ncbi:hypothetical protein B0T14DRAFT_565476 [Immersiella caudata]|uniref:Uncharacterized protein n=1 Tax=Immersiella caudata TaxID=314043 RepID=A0AA39WYX4_9PEZI|nr:hypothetical protein B0T14DRAFT_565476 [Immersiella caudata]
MKLILHLAAVIQLLVAYATASPFYVWNTYIPKKSLHSGGQQFAFFHEAELDDRGRVTCDLLTDTNEIYPACLDASSNWCVVCDGDGCPYDKRDAYKITRLEFHTSWGHYTWYKDQDHRIKDTDGKDVGECIPWGPEGGAAEMNCTFPDSAGSDLRGRYRLGSSALYCKSDIF